MAEVEEVCACALINCDILPGYPPNSKVNELIGSALTSLASNYDSNVPVNEFIYTLNGNSEVLIEIVVQSGRYAAVVSLLGTFNVFPNNFISDVYDPTDDERVITVFFPIQNLFQLNPNSDLINQVYEVSRPIPNTGLIASQGDIAQNSGIARLGWNLTGKDVKIVISEIKRPQLDSYLVAENIASQLEGRISFRRAMKQSVSEAMRMGAVGIRVMCAGRLGGAEMARTEQYKEGRIPLHTLRADIDYGTVTAQTIYGSIGVKVWICKGEIIGKQ